MQTRIAASIVTLLMLGLVGCSDSGPPSVSADLIDSDGDVRSLSWHHLRKIRAGQWA